MHRDLHPLAPSQETLWEFLWALSPDDPGAARLPVVDFRRVTGPLDVDALQAALHDVMRRHHALRTVFPVAGAHPLAAVLPEIEPVLTVDDLSHLPEQKRAERLDELVHAERFRAFDLRDGPLWHVRLVHLTPVDHILSVCFFHVISDGWGCRLFMEDLVHTYGSRLGAAAPQPATDIGLPRLTALQRTMLPATAERDSYWRRQLLPLPTAPVFPPLQTPLGDDLTAEVGYPFTFAPETTQRLRATAWRARTTVFVALLAAWHVLLCRRTGRNRLVAGTTTLGRDRPPARQLINQFTNNVYLGVQVSPGESFFDVLTAMHASMADAVQHTSAFYRTARAVCPDFDRRRPWSFLNLFDYWFQSEAPASPQLPHPDGSINPVSLGGEAAIGRSSAIVKVSDVAAATLPVWARRGVPIIVLADDRKSGSIVYNRNFYRGDLIADLAAEYEDLVAAVAADPARPLTGLTTRPRVSRR